MPGRNFLFIPDPTNVPRRIQNAMLLIHKIHGESCLKSF
jgi:hypothetical protein